MKHSTLLLAALLFVSPFASAQDSSGSATTELPGRVATKLKAVEDMLVGLENSIKRMEAGEFSDASPDDYLQLKMMVESAYDTPTRETYLQFAKKHGQPNDQYEAFAQNMRINSLMGLARKFDVPENHPKLKKVTARYNELMGKFYDLEKKASQ